MLNRLIENWLVRANERSYQIPFCQMLAAEGHTVVHSTRHSQIEFGKDVITIAPDGVPCAFQLKGNPGSRFILSQFRDVSPQLFELASQPIVHAGVDDKIPHRCYLVVNSEVDEEVHHAIAGQNQMLERLGLGASKITLWSIGQLLAMAQKLGEEMWPSEFSDLHQMLDLLALPGTDNFPTKLFDPALQRILRLRDEDKVPTKAGFVRAVSSAALFSGIALSRFHQAENHWAVIKAWTMMITYTIAAHEKHKLPLSPEIAEIVRLARQAIYEALASIATELETNPGAVTSAGLEISDIYLARLTLLNGLMSVYWFWSERESWGAPAHRDFIRSWLPRGPESSILWGEGAVPQILAHYWYFSAADGTWTSEWTLAGLVSSVIDHALQKGQVKFPSPYYDFEDLCAHNLASFLEVEDPLKHETATGLSYTAESLLHLLVRANFKQTCKGLWSKFSAVSTQVFTPKNPWQYCLSYAETGAYSQIQPVHTKQWDDLVQEARDTSTGHVPDALRADPLLLLIFIIIFPYRATPEVVRFLGREFSPIWMI